MLFSCLTIGSGDDHSYSIFTHETRKLNIKKLILNFSRLTGFGGVQARREIRTDHLRALERFQPIEAQKSRKMYFDVGVRDFGAVEEVGLLK